MRGAPFKLLPCSEKVATNPPCEHSRELRCMPGFYMGFVDVIVIVAVVVVVFSD